MPLDLTVNRRAALYFAVPRNIANAPMKQRESTLTSARRVRRYDHRHLSLAGGDHDKVALQYPGFDQPILDVKQHLE
jgi:hypothetical protein